MGLIRADRVKETTTTTGTSAYALGGAFTGFVTFSSAMANGDTCLYSVEDGGGGYEVGIGTWNTGNTLSRTTIIKSSNSDAAVSWSAGTKNIVLTLTAEDIDIYVEKTQSVTAATTTTVDLKLGNILLLDHSTNVTTLTLNNVPGFTGRTYSITIERTKDASGTARSITWPASFKWPGGTAPTLTSTTGAVDIITAYTRNAGTTWRAFFSLASA